MAIQWQWVINLCSSGVKGEVGNPVMPLLEHNLAKQDIVEAL